MLAVLDTWTVDVCKLKVRVNNEAQDTSRTQSLQVDSGSLDCVK